jgi:hypothetical protein
MADQPTESKRLLSHTIAKRACSMNSSLETLALHAEERRITEWHKTLS